jgi:hypothetical protein
MHDTIARKSLESLEIVYDGECATFETAYPGAEIFVAGQATRVTEII